MERLSVITGGPSRPWDVLVRTSPGQAPHKPPLEGLSAAPLLPAAFLEIYCALPTSPHRSPPSNSAPAPPLLC